MDVVHRGFDGLDVSFQGQIDKDFAEQLEVAKTSAADEREEQLLEFRGVKMHVAETGARGGYAYRCDTGPFGATWFFKKPNKHDPWGIRVSCKALPLATLGLGRVRADLYAVLDALGIATTTEGVSIGRVDVAVDVLAPGFILEPDNFVMHSQATRADHIEGADVQIHGRSGRCTSVTIGKNPGRVVILYDKRAQVVSKRKVEWWEIWNANRQKDGLPPLNQENRDESAVWRVELRAGKKHLKDKWRIRTWADLHDRLGDLKAKTLNAVRYAMPALDTNRARWPDDPIWGIARREIAGDLFQMRSHTNPDLIRKVLRAEHRRILLGQMSGISVGLAVTDGKDAAAYTTSVRTLPSALLDTPTTTLCR